MTFTVTFDTGTFSTNAGTIGILAIFTGTGHAFLFLLSEKAILISRFPTVRPDFDLSFLFFITLAILFLDIFYPVRERAVGSRGRNYPNLGSVLCLHF